MPATSRISARPTISRIPPSANRPHRPINRSANRGAGQSITAAGRRIECPIAVDCESGAAAECRVECAIAVHRESAQRQAAATSSRTSGQEASQRSGSSGSRDTRVARLHGPRVKGVIVVGKRAKAVNARDAVIRREHFHANTTLLDARAGRGGFADGTVLFQNSAQSKFATPDDAAKALLQALKADNMEQIAAIFGRKTVEAVASGDTVSDKRDREVVRLAMEQSWRWAPLGPDRQELIIGDEQWPFPVPLAKSGDQWVFDAEAGKEEVIARRIGRNELGVIDLCHGTWTCRRNMRQSRTTGNRLGYTPSTCAALAGTKMGLLRRIRRETQSDGRSGCGSGGGGLCKESDRRFAVLGLPVSYPNGTRRRGAGRQEKLRRERRHAGRLRARGVSCQIRIKRHHDFHRESGPSRVPEGFGKGHAEPGRQYDGV